LHGSLRENAEQGLARQSLFFNVKSIKMNLTLNNTDFPGCYVMFNKQNVAIYAGMSQNIQHRLKNHPIREKINSSIDEVKIQAIMVNNKQCRLMTESRLIKWYRPKYNIYHNPDAKLSPGQMELFKI
jgi:excinuclease UvrABC nuclease subunit